MSPTRPEYRKLGMDLVSVEDNFYHTPNKPSMVKENKNGGVEYSINLFLEKSLT
jgi:hypothetical protein